MAAGSYLELHLDACRLRNLRPGTIKQRRYALLRLSRSLGDKAIIDATTDDLVAFISRPQGAEGRATEISHLRQFYKWAVIAGHRADDPTVRLVRPRLPRRLPRPITEGDLFVALDLAPERIRPWLLLAAYAGLRCLEISNLRADDLWWHLDPPLLVVTDGKGGHADVVPIGSYLAGELRSSGLPSRGYLFPRRDGQPGPTPPHRVSQVANDFLRDIGVPATIHQLRHRFGTQAYRATGRDLRLTQELLRHKSPVSTAIYTALDPAEAAEAVDRMPAPR